MRKSLLAVAALMGASALPAKAAMFKVDDQTFANFGYMSQIWAQNLGARATGQKSRTNFSITNAKIYFSGQVNKMVKFHAEFDASVNANNAAGNTRLGDAHITLAFAPELNIIAGYQRLPFSRQTLSSGYAAIIPTGYGYGRVAGGAPVFASASIGAASVCAVRATTGTCLSTTNVGGAGSRDAGLSIMSNIMDGMIVFRGGIFDGRFDGRTANTTNESLALAFRIQFTPTMLGYKGETGYAISDTYLGKQNVLTLGVGYNTQKDKTTPAPNNTWKMLTIDVNWEQKFGDMIPNIQIGYNDLKDYNAAKDDAKAFWAQGQLLYDQVVGLGKPALALGWFYSEQKPAGGGAKPKVTRYALYFNYYIKGNAAKIQAGMDTFSRNNADKGTTGKNYTDFTLALQTQF